MRALSSESTSTKEACAFPASRNATRAVLESEGVGDDSRAGDADAAVLRRDAYHWFAVLREIISCSHGCLQEEQGSHSDLSTYVSEDRIYIPLKRLKRSEQVRLAFIWRSRYYARGGGALVEQDCPGRCRRYRLKEVGPEWQACVSRPNSDKDTDEYAHRGGCQVHCGLSAMSDPHVHQGRPPGRNLIHRAASE